MPTNEVTKRKVLSLTNVARVLRRKEMSAYFVNEINLVKSAGYMVFVGVSFTCFTWRYNLLGGYLNFGVEFS
jgi:hypothetical protein